MFWILALVVPGLAFSILHLILARGWTLWTALGVLALILAIGFYGRAKGREMTDNALATFEGGDREEIREQGYKESSRPLQLAGVVDGILVIGVIIGEIRRRQKRR